MDKTVTLAQLADSVNDGERLAFGGSGLVRKPLAAAAAIGAGAARDLNLIAFLGGPEVDLLVGLGKVATLHFAYVGMDMLGLAPNFRRARQSGSLHAVEMTESTVLTGFEAAARGVPFLPSRSPLSTDVMTTPTNAIGSVTCPFTGELLAAVPALALDTAVLHVNVADRSGNAVILGDMFGDLLMAQAARRVFVTAERVVDEFGPEHRGTAQLSRLWIDGVCELPLGAGFTAVYPDYPIDFAGAQSYQSSAGDADWLRGFDGIGSAA